jgi:hypothetical protein
LMHTASHERPRARRASPDYSLARRRAGTKRQKNRRTLTSEERRTTRFSKRIVTRSNCK